MFRGRRFGEMSRACVFALVAVFFLPACISDSAPESGAGDENVSVTPTPRALPDN